MNMDLVVKAYDKTFVHVNPAGATCTYSFLAKMRMNEHGFGRKGLRQNFRTCEPGLKDSFSVLQLNIRSMDKNFESFK